MRFVFRVNPQRPSIPPPLESHAALRARRMPPVPGQRTPSPHRPISWRLRLYQPIPSQQSGYKFLDRPQGLLEGGEPFSVPTVPLHYEGYPRLHKQMQVVCKQSELDRSRIQITEVIFNITTCCGYPLEDVFIRRKITYFSRYRLETRGPINNCSKTIGLSNGSAL